MLGSQGGEGFDVPFEESTRIPLLIRYPRRIRPGVEEQAPISNVDFAPTLLSLCGAKLPQGMQGINHAPRWTGGRKAPPQSIYAEGELDGENAWRMMVHGRHKLVVNSEMRPTHLYDLSADPYELNNSVAQGSARGTLDALLPWLRSWTTRTGDRLA
jgi:uncharacterized sulfatase